MNTRAVTTALALAAILIGCGGKDAKDKPATATAYAPDTDTAFTDRRDGQTYRTVKTDTQVWMAENLNYAAEGSVCYKNSADSCAKYGRLYDWAAANKACPAGFHLPTADEWTELTNYAGGWKIADRKLKSADGWYGGGWYGCCDDGADAYGFSALPGGLAYNAGSFGNARFGGYWWSATEHGVGYAWHRSMHFHNGGKLYGDGSDKTFLFSVRCVVDNNNMEGTPPLRGEPYPTL